MPAAAATGTAPNSNPQQQQHSAAPPPPQLPPALNINSIAPPALSSSLSSSLLSNNINQTSRIPSSKYFLTAEELSPDVIQKCISKQQQQQQAQNIIIAAPPGPVDNNYEASDRSNSAAHLVLLLNSILHEQGVRRVSYDALDLLIRIIREVGFDLLQESEKLAVYAGKQLIDDKDIKFAFTLRYRRNLIRNPDIGLVKELSLRKNCMPLQNIKSSNKLSLPSDRNMLLGRNFTITNAAADADIPHNQSGDAERTEEREVAIVGVEETADQQQLVESQRIDEALDEKGAENQESNASPVAPDIDGANNKDAEEVVMQEMHDEVSNLSQISPDASAVAASHLMISPEKAPDATGYDDGDDQVGGDEESAVVEAKQENID